MAMRVTKLKKGSKRTVMDCENRRGDVKIEGNKPSWGKITV